jgi:two-component system sensor histidine kinase DesK
MRTLRSWFERIFIPAIAATYAVSMPVWSYGRVLAEPHQHSAAVAGAVAAACSVVLQVWLLVPMARGQRPRHASWLVAVFVVINAAAFPVIGAPWLAAGEQLAVLAAVFLRLRWSVPAVAILTAAPAVVWATGHDLALGHYFTQNTVFWPLTMGPLIWLARAAAQLRSGRQELVGSAVIAERVRIDDELEASLGAELERLIAAGQRAARAAGQDPAAAERELRALTETSRSALAQTRRMASRYQAITVRSEVSTAVALLAAAGIPADVDVPAAVLGQPLDSARLAGFRSGLTTVLHDQAPGEWLITADGGRGDLRLAIRRLGGEPR